MIRPLPTRRARPAAWVRVIRLMLLSVGLGLLSAAGYMLIRARVFQIYEGRAFDSLLSQQDARPLHSGAAAGLSTTQSRTPRHFKLLLRGEPIARIEIPSVGLKTLVLEGDDARTLELGAGHIPGTALPGADGNIGIAGHRDTVFRCLRNLKKNQIIILDTPDARYTYRVEALTVVNPTQTSVLRCSHQDVLTLVTCYPFHFIGAAPQRFIVRARMVSPLSVNVHS